MSEETAPYNDKATAPAVSFRDGESLQSALEKVTGEKASEKAAAEILSTLGYELREGTGPYKGLRLVVRKEGGRMFFKAPPDRLPATRAAAILLQHGLNCLRRSRPFA